MTTRIGHNYIGHNYVDHNYVDHDYIDHDYANRYAHAYLSGCTVCLHRLLQSQRMSTNDITDGCAHVRTQSYTHTSMRRSAPPAPHGLIVALYSYDPI